MATTYRRLCRFASRDAKAVLAQRFVPGQNVKSIRIDQRPVDVEEGSFDHFSIRVSTGEQTAESWQKQVRRELSPGQPVPLKLQEICQ